MGRLTKHLLIGGISTLAILLGTGFSSFVFFESQTFEQEILGQGDNIRENFVFGESEDVSVLNTKYYTVHFMSQAVSSGLSYYNGAGGYSPVFGVFGELTNDDISDIRNHNGTLVYQPGTTYVNEIRFDYVSSINVEMLRAIGAPRPLGGRLIDGNTDGYFSLDFLCWSTTSDADVYDENGGWVSYNNEDNYYYRAYGIFPTATDFPNVPNFNQNIEDIFGDNVSVVDGVNHVYVYPYYSGGKNNRSVTNDRKNNNPNLFDSITLRTVGGTSYEYAMATDINSNTFTLDQQTKSQLRGSNFNNVNCYRLTGVEFKTGTQYVIANDIDRVYGSWSGNRLYVKNDQATELKHGYESDFDSDNWYDKTCDGDYKYSYSKPNHDNDLVLSGQEIAAGRYNVYLFVKEANRYYGNRQYTVQEPSDSESNFALGDFASAKAALNAMDVHIAYSYECSTSSLSTLRSTWLGVLHYAYQHSTRDYMVFLERTYEMKMLGGFRGYDYDAASGNEPLFVQDSTDATKYEASNVAMSGSTYGTLSVDGVGSLTLPDTYFTVSLDGTLMEDIYVPTVTYDDGVPTEYTSIQTGSKTTITSESADWEYPTVEIRDITTADESGNYKTVTEYYMGRHQATDASGNAFIEYNMSVCTLVDYLFGNEVTDPANYRFRSMMSSDIDLDGRDIVEYLKTLGSTELETFKANLAKAGILRVPNDGAYNLFVDLSFTEVDGIDHPRATVYAYQIHNIFVKIIDYDFDIKYKEGNPMYVNVDDDAYVNDGIHGCYSNLDYYYIYEELGLDDVYVLNGIKWTLGAIFKKMGSSKCLMDIVTGRYVTPNSIIESPFSIMKNYVFRVVDIPLGRTDVIWDNLKIVWDRYTVPTNA